MKITPTRLKDVMLIEPLVFGDNRGFFLETYRKNQFAQSGIDVDFVQDNLSFYRRGTLRGLHYQHPCDQAKLVQVLEGEIVDVAVDIRLDSPTHGQWVAVSLKAEDHRALYIPMGYAHGFYVVSETALFAYKCSDYYAPEHEGGVIWNDPTLKIDWPVGQPGQSETPILAERDTRWPELDNIPHHRLPKFDLKS